MASSTPAPVYFGNSTGGFGGGSGMSQIQQMVSERGSVGRGDEERGGEDRGIGEGSDQNSTVGQCKEWCEGRGRERERSKD